MLEGINLKKLSEIECDNIVIIPEKISKINIHHMAGNLSVETCGNNFAPKKENHHQIMQ